MVKSHPIINKNDGIITKFEIQLEKHKNAYNFEDPVKLIEDIFAVVDIKFITDEEKELVIKSSFSIVNYQLPPQDINNVVGLYCKSFWSTKTYYGRFFNEFVKASLTNDIKKELW